MTAGRTGAHSGPPGRCVGDLCIRQSFRPDGSWKIVEPMAGDKLEDNLNPVGRLYYAGSTLRPRWCACPHSLLQEVGTALGA